MHESGERDRLIEHALRQTLRRPMTPAGLGECVDAEGLAAWTSGALRRADAASVEQHVSQCARCQALLATFVRTTPAAPIAGPRWHRWHLRWLVPFATAATAVALWVIAPGLDRTRAPEQPAETSDVRGERPAAQIAQPPAAPATIPEMVAAPKRPPTGRTDSAAGSTAATSFRTPADTLARNQNREQPALNERARVLEERSPTVASAETEKIGADRAVAKEARAARPAVLPPPPAASPAAAAAQSDRAGAPLGAMRQEAAAIELRSPNPAIRWRISVGRQVERSTTGGAQWEPVTIPVGVGLTAGSAPTPSVCWLVGRAGAVYLTTDGLRFERVPFVEPLDLASVVAIDDRTATVTAVDGRVFRTTDRGITWSRPPEH